MLQNNTDLAAMESEMLARVFEWLLQIPDEFLLPPEAPDEFSGPTKDENNGRD